MHDRPRIRGKCLITWLLSLAFMMSLVLVPASAAGFDGATFAAPILQDVERIEKDNLAEPETLLRTFSREPTRFLTSDVKEQLSTLQLSNEIPQQAQLIRDNFLNREVTRLTFDTYEADIDQTGQVVSMTNYADMHDNDPTILDGENTDPNAYPVTKEEALDLADQISKEYQLDNYQLVECSNDIPATWLLLWHNRLDNGVLNPCDMITVTIDARDGSVMLMDRNSEVPEVTDVVVTEAGAVRRSQPLRNELGGLSINSTTLTVFRPNFHWESTEVEYQEADFVRLAWCVTLEDGSVIYIDSQTGEILGGSSALEYARSVCAEPSFTDSQQCVDLAREGLEELGYVHHLNSVNYHINQDDIEYVLNRSNLKALYLTCHGSRDSKRIGAEGWEISYTQIKSGYKFVYLDACFSSLKNYFAKAFLGSEKERKAFVGWNVRVLECDSASFNRYFWPQIGRMTILDAVLVARSTALSNYRTSCNPGFYGDASYSGRA